MLKKLKFSLILLSFLTVSTASAQTCDFDLDGLSDPLSYDSATHDWRANLSAGGEFLVENFGDDNNFLIPGNYQEAGEPTNIGFVPADLFWNIRLADGSVDFIPRFGFTNSSFLGGHDFNGDGLADAVKIINRCGGLNERCAQNKSRFNVFFNEALDGNPFEGSILESGFFGRRLDPLFVIDANGDGADDVCYGRQLRNKPTQFRAICKNIEGIRVARFTLGKIFNLPTSVMVNGEDLVVTWKTQNRRDRTRIHITNTLGQQNTFFVPGTGEIVIGNWQGEANEEIGIVKDGVLNIIDPLTGASLGTLASPAGEAIDCKNNFNGRAGETFLTTRNVCRVFDCS